MSNGKRGGQPGNQNAAKANLWRAAIMRALDQKTKKEGKDALDALAHKLIEKVEEGEISAIREFGDRIDGKAAQAMILQGDEEKPVQVEGKINLVRPG